LEDDGSGKWALLNLISALVGICIAVVAVVHAVRKGREDKDGGTERSEERSSARPLIAAIAAVAGIVFFFITEDVSLPWTFVDKWTVVSVLILIAVIAAAALTVRDRENDRS
jgi:cytochrome bd-type quinol oxidase subunit 2